MATTAVDRTVDDRQDQLRDKFRGCYFGLAVGDALGSQVEFYKPGTFPEVTAMVGGGPHRLQPGQFTDDMSMALCLSESLLLLRANDPKDQLQRYVRWYQTGHLSSTGRCFDIGYTTRQALDAFEETGKEYPGSTDSQSSGNGSVMRLAPVPMYYFRAPLSEMEEFAQRSSRTTHGSDDCRDGVVFYSYLIRLALEGKSKDEILDGNTHQQLHRKLGENTLEVARGSYKTLQPPTIWNSGYVVKSIEAALWGFYRFDNFNDGLLAIVNLGKDSDTVGAIYGMLAGAYYGYQAIPTDYLDKAAFHGLILAHSDELLAHALDPSAPVSEFFVALCLMLDRLERELSLMRHARSVAQVYETCSAALYATLKEATSQAERDAYQVLLPEFKRRLDYVCKRIE
eukprot:jgi/Mesvir1/29465/Mv23040-RA.1